MVPITADDGIEDITTDENGGNSNSNFIWTDIDLDLYRSSCSSGRSSNRVSPDDIKYSDMSVQEDFNYKNRPAGGAGRETQVRVGAGADRKHVVDRAEKRSLRGRAVVPKQNTPARGGHQEVEIPGDEQ
ncbi:Hypothetical protein CINCED_3A008618 [Cinara cedri]|uniref:Uncharacterized protein n=1 Tax=Cinara cedri TaxID=506608 RepID=A0A5E4M8Y0_9HEMI|nr:Hypothetical protein CINCED_3A008618 [Cinara cedri]